MPTPTSASSTLHDSATAAVPKGWNPRYVAYAQAHGRTPEEQGAHDEEAWPGGKACGFMLWMNARWTEWCALKGYRRTAGGHNDTPLTDDDHRDFTFWLLERAATQLAQETR